MGWISLTGFHRACAATAFLPDIDRDHGVLVHDMKWSGFSAWQTDIFCQRFESLSVFLNDRNRDMASLAGVDIPDGAGFTGVYAADNLAPRAILEFARWCGFHCCCFTAC
jgi:hypothetical protein